MAYINSRDVDIFRCLSSGARKLADIRDNLKKFEFDAKAGSENKIRAASDEPYYSRDMTLAALRTRINILRKDDYIQSQLYRTRKGPEIFALYCLTDLSIDVLVENGMERDHTRACLPHKFGVVHEMMVTEVVRTIKQESGRLFYKFRFHDENTLKSRARGAKLRYPDLLVTLYIPRDGSSLRKVVAVEIDNDTLPNPRVIEKAVGVAEQYSVPSMILCTTGKRIAKLQNEFRIAFPNKNAEMSMKVFFALTHDFTHKGFVDTRWLNMWDEQATVVMLK
jgi:hypothetical protein